MFGRLDELPFPDSRHAKIQHLQKLGFEICPYSFIASPVMNEESMTLAIETLKSYAEEKHLPIDGIVIIYDSLSYSSACGRTGHHYKDGLAFKFEDETYETILKDIEWTTTRFGEIAPVAIFDTVEIDGCAVSRASLHNLTFIKDLELAVGCRIAVSKRNMIIPHVDGKRIAADMWMQYRLYVHAVAHRLVSISEQAAITGSSKLSIVTIQFAVVRFSRNSYISLARRQWILKDYLRQHWRNSLHWDTSHPSQTSTI